MFILVHHAISDPKSVWTNAQKALGALPAHVTLHHSLAAPDGHKATCVWEAESISKLKSFLDPTLGPGAKNDYSEVINKTGIAVPPAFQLH